VNAARDTTPSGSTHCCQASHSAPHHLTLVYHLTQSNDITGDQAPRTQMYAEDTFLTIAKD